MTDFSAEDALEARQRNPRAAVEMARAVLRGTEDRAEWSIAERAIGLALREMHDFPGAARHLRRSIKIAADASLPRLSALAQMSLAWVLVYTGKHKQALKALDDAMPELAGADAVAALMQRGVVFHYLTRHDDAQRDYTAAIAGARRVALGRFVRLTLLEFGDRFERPIELGVVFGADGRDRFFELLILDDRFDGGQLRFGRRRRRGGDFR